MGILSRIGVGNATIDFVVPDNEVTVGESKQCQVKISGGNEEQAVDGVYAALRTNYLTPEGHHEITIQEYELSDGITIKPDAEEQIEVEIEIPESTPLTRGKTQVWVDAGLRIDWGNDPSDTDILTVKPNDMLNAFDRAIERLGYKTEAHEPISTAGTPLASHGTFAQEITITVEESDEPYHLVYTIEDGKLVVGLHQDTTEDSGVGPFITDTSDPAVISNNIASLFNSL